MYSFSFSFVIVIITCLTQLIIVSGFDTCFGGCFRFNRVHKLNKTKRTNRTRSIGKPAAPNPLLDLKLERLNFSLGEFKPTREYPFALLCNPPKLERRMSFSWSHQAVKAGETEQTMTTVSSDKSSIETEQGITLASPESSEQSSDRSWTGTVPLCHDQPNDTCIQEMVRQTYYEWQECVFDELSMCDITNNKTVTTQMLLSAHLQIAQIGHDQIGDCFSLESGSQHIEESYQSVSDLFRDIPLLFELNYSHIIVSRFQKLTNSQSFKEITGYLVAAMHSNSSNASEDVTRIQRSSILNIGEDSPMQEELIYNLALRKANFSEEHLSEVYRIGKYRKIQTMANKVPHNVLSLQVAIRHIMNQEKALAAIVSIIQDDDDVSVSYELVTVQCLMSELLGIARTAFPDTEFTLTATYYNKLAKIWIPVTLIRLLAMKFALHSRRDYWGRNARNLHTHFALEHVIIYDPFDIVLRISMSDNCPPMRQTRLEYLNQRMLTYKTFNAEQVDDDFEHRDRWLNDVYFFSSWVASIIGGKFGIKNLYEGTGDMRDKRSSTRVMYLEFSILRGHHNNISIDDVEEIERMGVNEITRSNAMNGSADAFYSEEKPDHADPYEFDDSGFEKQTT